MEYTKMNWNRSALIIIDMQKDFAKKDGASYIQGTEDVTENIVNLASVFRNCQLPVIHVIRLYKEDGSNAELCRKSLFQDGKKIVSPGSNGAKIVTELLPENAENYSDISLLNGQIIPIAPYDFIVYKPRWGAFYSTQLDDWLTSHQINSLLIAGCNFPNCPRATIYEASERDYHISIVPETISGIYPKGIDELKGIGVGICSVKELKNIIKTKRDE